MIANLWILTLKQGNRRKERHSPEANIMATANLETKEKCKRDLHLHQIFKGYFFEVFHGNLWAMDENHVQIYW